MDKRKVVKWLEGFICEHSTEDEEICVPLLTKDLGITPEEAHEVLAECEEKLIEMFLEWYNEVSEVVALKKLELTCEETFKLGFAYGSFSVNEIDQGLHIVMPVTCEDGDPENEFFDSLFTEYFDKIPDDLAPEQVSEIYMGAIAAFVNDNQLGLVGDDFITSYEDVKE